MGQKSPCRNDDETHSGKGMGSCEEEEEEGEEGDDLGPHLDPLEPDNCPKAPTVNQGVR